MLDHSGRPASRTARVFVSTIALAGAAYLTYLAVSYIHSGCSCSGGDTTAAGIVRATLLIVGATALYVLSAALAFLIVRNRVR